MNNLTDHPEQTAVKDKGRIVRRVTGIIVIVLLLAAVAVVFLIIRHQADPDRIARENQQRTEEASERSIISHAESEWNTMYNLEIQNYIKNSADYSVQDCVASKMKITEKSASNTSDSHSDVTLSGTVSVTFYERDNTLSQQDFDFTAVYGVDHPPYEETLHSLTLSPIR